MRIKTIRVSAGRTVPHPNESYANLKFFVELTAELGASLHQGMSTADAVELATYVLAGIERRETEEP